MRVDVDFASDKLFNLGEKANILGGAEADRISLGLSPCGAPDPVDVAVGGFRHVKIDNERNGADINPPGGDISGNEDGHFSGPEAGEGLLTCTLGLIPVNGIAGKAMLVQLAGQFFGPVFGAAENDCGVNAGAVALTTKVALKKGHFVLLADETDLLEDILEDGFIGGDRDADGIPDKILGHPFDILVDGGGKEGRLAVPRHGLGDTADIIDKAHVEHPVNFVKDEKLDAAEVHVALLHQVDEASGRGDKNVDTLCEAAGLGMLTDATIDKGMAETEVSAISGKTFPDLNGKLACRGEDERTRLTTICWFLASQEVVQDGEGEGGGLPGSRLGTTHEVATFKLRGNGLRLDRRGHRVLLVAQGAVDGLCQGQILESDR